MSASRPTKPFTAHPAFPAIVALWFAALLGLGTFVVPPANFEGLVVGTGLAELLPAAAPPLGDTARLAISAVAALLGALLGLAIAAHLRRVQNRSQTRSEDTGPAVDSPWLADDENVPAQEIERDPIADPAGLDDLADAEAPGTVPGRLARRRSTREQDDSRAADEAGEAETQAGRIFQVSEVPPGEATEADEVAAESSESSESSENADNAEDAPGEEDDDLQRFAADRLVAGLPRIRSRNFDDEPLEDWSSPEPEPEPVIDELAPAAELAVTEPRDPEFAGPDVDGPDGDGPDFEAIDFRDSEPVEDAEYEELPTEAPQPALAADDEPVDASEATDGEFDDTPKPAPLDSSTGSLSELVARFDAALAAQRSRSLSGPASQKPARPEADRSDDPVIAFLRREADRDRGATGEPRDERRDDPRAGLRNALDKLDRACRQS